MSKLCKDCRHFDGSHFCLSSRREPDYVFGNNPGHYSAANERAHSTEGSCGPSAIRFKPKVSPADDGNPF